MSQSGKGRAGRRGAIAALQAAAFLTVATGLADLLRAPLPRLDLLVPYLVAVAVSTLLDGLLAGLLASLVAVAAHALLFSAHPDARTIALDLGKLLAVVVVCALVRGFVRSRRRREPEPQLFAPATRLLDAAPHDHGEVLTAIEELRADLQEGRYREAALEKAYAAARDTLSARVRDLEAEAAREHERHDELRAALDRAMADLKREREHAHSAKTALADAQQALESASLARNVSAALRRELEDVRAAHGREVESARAEATALEKALAAARVSRDRDVAMLDQQLADERAAHEQALSTARADATALSARVADIEHQLADARAARDRDVAALDKQLADERAAHVRALNTARADATALSARVAEIERQLADARAARDRDVAALEKQLADERAAQLRAVDTSRADATALSARVGEANARITTLERQLIDERTTHARELETARGGAASLSGRIAELERQLADARGQQARDAEAVMREAGTRVAAIEKLLVDERAAHVRELESARGRIADFEKQLDGARADAAMLTARAAGLQQLVDAERSGHALDEAHIAELEQRVAELEREAKAAHERREQEVHEFDTRLQSIVSHLATDHEADLGQAIADKEEARAELRSTNARLSALQHRIEQERETFRAAQEKWIAARQSLLAKLQSAEERYRRMSDENTRAVAQMRDAARVEIDRLRARVAELARHEPPSAAPRAKILIAHPDSELRNAACISLERIGYEVMTAADGLEGLRVASSSLPHVVIADAVMPKMDGRELCQLLKSQERTASILIVLLTRETDMRTFAELGPDAVLTKPVPFETMRATLETLLTRAARTAPS